MQTNAQCLPGLSLFLLSGLAFAQSPCEERVASDCFYSGIFPFNAITQLFVEQDNGDLSAYGTGFLVSPHCALTNGHCVYKRGEQVFFYKDIWMMPGACRSASGISFNLLGIRETLIKRTNSKWTDLSYDWETEVDYGSLRFVCPFEEITTFLPLCFDASPSSVHMAGYPLEELPDAGDLFNQWIA
jgi:V8-like Glu-specific endopeptidase